VTKDMVNTLLLVFQVVSRNTFYPMLQHAIKVGSAFEGWNPYENDITYCLFVPLSPPLGHTFHLERGTDEETLARNFRIRVELVCTCTWHQLPGEMLCFLHNPQEELRRNQQHPSLLGTLCTSSYLDVEKTARWFRQLVKACWKILPESSICCLNMLPSRRSCKFQVKKNNGKSLTIELMFGVQQGDSDIFVSNQSIEAIIPSTTWPESYAVAESKFFKHMARRALRDSFHLKCLRLCTHILVGTGFSSYTLKTVVMHLLTTTPMSDWHRRDFLLRLQHIMWYLRCCLEQRCLEHFFFGNEKVPEEISLPLDLQMAKPLNLFHHLAQDPAAHAEALLEFHYVHDR
ncbi:IPIL1 protein, partial [Aegotheles bennettii]|nr:IPIL1 protein [Aegotheles bennettii]